MAFRAGKRKEVKKQSYYVWFLGAKESKGLRGEEYVRPVLRYLLEKERELEPMKVTLQVSNKGMKIIQNVPRKTNKGKTEQIKHFIPHHAITCVTQEAKPNDDIVCGILLLYNPLTKCPVHVHAYRCDSVETANTLRHQLQILIERPENQKKFREIENRLDAKGLLPTRRLNSDGRSTRTEGSDRTDDSGGSSERDAGVPTARKDHIASLYDSLAAELRERLNNPDSCPILLPPKDYDTVSRKHGKLSGIDNRKSTNANLVGLNVNKADASPGNKESGSSGKSSGIGSDEALSSAIQEVTSHPDFEAKEIDPDTSSEEEDTEDWSDRKESPEDETSLSTNLSSPWRRPIYPNNSRPRYRPRSPSPSSPAPKPVPPVPLKVERARSRRSDRQPTESPESSPIRHRGPYANYPPRDANNRLRDLSPLARDKHRDLQRKFSQQEWRLASPPRGRPRERPVSYPSGRSPDHSTASTPAKHPGNTRPAYVDRQRYPPVTLSADRDRVALDPRHWSPEYSQRNRRALSPTGFAAYPTTPEHCYRDARRSVSPTEIYPPNRPSSRRLDLYTDRSPRSPVSPVPVGDDRRRTGYYGLPVDPRDYRHSFAESPYRRLQLSSQY